MTQDVSYTFLVEWYWRGQQGQHFSSVFMGIIRKALLDTYFASLSGGSSWLSQYFCSFTFSNQFYTCIYTHIYVHCTEGILVRIPQSMEKQKVFPTWHREGTWNSNVECKAKGMEWVCPFYLLLHHASLLWRRTAKCLLCTKAICQSCFFFWLPAKKCGFLHLSHLSRAPECPPWGLIVRSARFPEG